ncbi:MAG: glycosyltransferase family 2 protein [Dehalococcoidia bacterium]
MRSATPRVSIGMPVHNGGEILRTSIESVLVQDFEDFELIISDNASDDGTYELCLEYAAQDPRVRLYRSDVNLGAAPNYNRTLELARAEYFKWQCHDDWCEPTFLSRCVDVLDNDPSVIMAYPQTIIVDDQGNSLGYYEEPADASSHDPVQRFIRFYWDLALCNVLFGVMRTDVLKSTSNWHPSFWEGDKVLLAELALRGRMVEVPEPLFYRRYEAPRKRDNRWFDSNNPQGFGLRRPNHYYHQLRAVFAAPVSLRQKMAVATHIGLRFLVGQKTKRLLLPANTSSREPAGTRS